MSLDSDPRIRRGTELYRAGRPFEAHEAWEEAWLARRGTQGGELVRALIQLAAACVHLEQGRIGGFRSLATAASGRIEAALAHEPRTPDRDRWLELARAAREFGRSERPVLDGRPDVPGSAAGPGGAESAS